MHSFQTKSNVYAFFFFHYALALLQVPYSLTQFGRQEFRLVWDLFREQTQYGHEGTFLCYKCCAHLLMWICETFYLHKQLSSYLISATTNSTMEESCHKRSCSYSSTPPPPLFLFAAGSSNSNNLIITLFPNSIIICIAGVRHREFIPICTE